MPGKINDGKFLAHNFLPDQKCERYAVRISGCEMIPVAGLQMLFISVLPEPFMLTSQHLNTCRA